MLNKFATRSFFFRIGCFLLALGGVGFAIGIAAEDPGCSVNCNEYYTYAMRKAGVNSYRRYDKLHAWNSVSDAPLGGIVFAHNIETVDRYSGCNAFALACSYKTDAVWYVGKIASPGGCMFDQRVKRAYCGRSTTHEGVTHSWNEGEDQNH